MRLFLLTALTMTAFAANSVLNRGAVAGGHIDALTFAAIRLLSGAGMLVALLAWRAAREPGRRRAALRPEAPPMRLVGAISLVVYLMGFSLAYVALDAGLGALILFGMVQLTMFAGAIVAGEPVPRNRWIGAMAAFLGLVWLLAPGGGAEGRLAEAGLMALAGIGWGIYSLAARGASDPIAATGWNFVLAVPVLLAAIAVLPVTADPAGASGSGIALAALSGAVASALGYALWYAILPALGAARGAVAQLSVPVIALAGGVVFLGEAASLRLLLASALVLGGVAHAALGAPARRQP